MISFARCIRDLLAAMMSLRAVLTGPRSEAENPVSGNTLGKGPPVGLPGDGTSGSGLAGARGRRAHVAGIICIIVLTTATGLSAGSSLAPRPPEGHPRLLVRPDDLPKLRAARNDAAVAAEWAELRRRADLPASVRSPERYDPALVEAAEAHAFHALIDRDQAAARRAIGLVFQYLDEQLPFPRRHDDTRIIGRALFVMAEVYDWCYEALTDEERRRLVAEVPKHGALMEIKFPPLGQSSIVGHAGEAQLFRDLLSVGIALYDEEPSYYDIAAERVYRDFAPSRNFTYAGQFHHQGDAYGAYRFHWETWAALLLTRMGAAPPFEWSDMKQVPYWLMYLRRPDGGLVQDGDEYQTASNPPGTYWVAPRPAVWALFAGLFGDPQFGEEWRRARATIQPLADVVDDPILTLLLRPDQLGEASRDTLPLTRYFPEPAGAMIARTGWKLGPQSRDVVAYLKIGTHMFGNHQHADSGQFQLYYRGSLAIDAGLYQSPDTRYGSPHFLNYYQRSVAHNTLLIEEPAEVSSFLRRVVTNDGGQRYLVGGEDPFTSEEFWEQNRRMARVLAHYAGPDPQSPEVSLIKGELTPGYAPEKAAYVSRSMVFLRMPDPAVPAALVVFDQVESVKPEQRKVFLLHMQEEPQIDGAVATIQRTAPQTELHRLTAQAIAPVSGDTAGTRLSFDVRGWLGRPILQAELICHLPYAAASDAHLRLLVEGEEPRAALPVRARAESVVWDMTDWLRRVTAEGANDASLTLACRTDLSGIVATEEGRKPYLRIVTGAESFAGKLVQTTLLPSAGERSIEKIGGPGKEFWSAGQNWSVTQRRAAPLSGEEPGAWRIEVSDTSGGAAARFLHVEQVMDLNARPSPVRLVSAPGIVGAALPGRMVLGSEDGRWITKPSRFIVTSEDLGPDARTLVVITDLAAGDYALWSGDRIVAITAVVAPAHTMTARLTAGEYRLEPATQ